MIIRRILLILIGALFFLPGLGLLIEALSAPDLGADEPLAMLVGGVALTVVGVLLFWVSHDMGKKARAGEALKNDSDPTAIGLASMMAMKDIGDDHD